MSAEEAANLRKQFYGGNKSLVAARVEFQEMLRGFSAFDRRGACWRQNYFLAVLAEGGRAKLVEFMKRMCVLVDQGRLKDTDLSFVLYNRSCVHYMAEQYSEAVAPLRRLFNGHFEAIDLFLAFKVVCLLLESLLAERRTSAPVLTSSTCTPPVPSFESETGRLLAWLKRLCRDDVSEGDKNEDDFQKLVRYALHVYKARVAIEIKDLTAAQECAGTVLDCANEVAELALDNFYEFPLRRQLEASTRHSAVFVAAWVEANSNNFEGALKLMSSGIGVANRDARYYNNAGCVCMMMGKVHVATLLFKKALSDCHTRDGDKTTTPSPMAPKALVCYNTGLCLMQTGKYELAFASLAASMSAMKNHWVLWVRLGECCMHHDMAEKNKLIPNRNKMAGHIGSGKTRRIYIDNRDNHDEGARLSSTARNNTSKSSRAKILISETLELGVSNAVCYFRNALLLIRKYRQERVDNMKGTWEGEESTKDGNEGAGKGDGGGRGAFDFRAIEMYVVLQLACAHLTLGNYSQCLTAAQEVLRGAAVDEQSRFLAETYSVEALCALGRVEDAVGLLEPSSLPEEATLDGSEIKCEWDGDIDPALSAADASKLGILVNRSSALCLRGRLEEAERMLRETVRLCPNHNALIRNLVYVLLRQGRSRDALDVLRSREL